MKQNRMIITSLLTMLALMAPIPVSGAYLNAPVSPDMVCSVEYVDTMDPWSALNSNSIGEMSDESVVAASHDTVAGANASAPWSLLNAHSIGETSNDGFIAINPGPATETANRTDWSALNANSIGEMADSDSVITATGNANSHASQDTCQIAMQGNPPSRLSEQLAVHRNSTPNSYLGRVFA